MSPGALHMGHAFQATLMDIVIRYQRMSGKNTLWQMGTDHAGIATQMVVERQLNQNGKTRHGIGRDAFIQQVWDWKSHSGDMICKQFRRLGASVAWSKAAFTLDEPRSKAVRQAFITLYREGLIYKGKRLVNWDPKLQTAISDLEIVHREVTGTLWTIRYRLDQSDQGLEVATTRPETLFWGSSHCGPPPRQTLPTLDRSTRPYSINRSHHSYYCR